MAGESSKAGYMNNGTPETSSYLEIVPEIQATEATKDFDEVCSLEREECDEIMEYVKNNPGLVVKSLGSKGQIVLHVAVMAGETKKSKPPTSKCIEKGLSKAASDSNWYHALEFQDCKALISLLQENSCLVVQTGPEGWTVLHAAAYRGCVELVDQVLDLFKNEGQFEDKTSGVKVALDDLLGAKCGLFEAEAYDMAYFTCPTHIWLGLSRMSKEREMASPPKPDAFQHLKDIIIEIMEGEPAKKAFERLEEQYQSDKNYNFILDREELKFHYACQFPNMLGALDYIKTIVKGCLDLGNLESIEVLKYLLQLHNAQGQTPFHLSIRAKDRYLLDIVPQDNALIECFNAKDVRGWSALHYLVTTKSIDHYTLNALLADERIDPNAKTSRREPCFSEMFYYKNPPHGMTALHLAILHEDLESVELLLCHHLTERNALFLRLIVCGYESNIYANDHRFVEESSLFWSPLQLATIMGLSDVVRLLLSNVPKDGFDTYDERKLQNIDIEKGSFPRVPTLLLASATGNPDLLRLFLDNPLFDPVAKYTGATALHYATNAKLPKTKPEERFKKVNRFLLFTDLENLSPNTPRYKEELEDIKVTSTEYLGRKACITMLLQAGVDVWEKDEHKRLPGAGPQAPEEVHLWWHEQMARETLEAKKSLNEAANAISVVAALVATASFVGPLQPPLGYGGDSVDGGIEDTHLSVRVFMVSNILSFYLAIACIMFAVVPSLPMPQEGIYAEWQRTRRSVSVAIFFLIMSVLGVLISFGAASNSIVSQGYSWQHAGLSFYPTLLGGFICILGISLFFLRLLRLVFNTNPKIRFLYKRFVKF